MDGAVVLNWGSDTIKAGQLSRFPSDSEPYVVRHGLPRSGRPPSHTHLFCQPCRATCVSGATRETSRAAAGNAISGPATERQSSQWRRGSGPARRCVEARAARQRRGLGRPRADTALCALRPGAHSLVFALPPHFLIVRTRASPELLLAWSATRKVALANARLVHACAVCSITPINNFSHCTAADAQLVLRLGSTRRGDGSRNFRSCAQLGWQAGDEGNLLLAEAQGTPKVDRETATQLMFETFNVAVSLSLSYMILETDFYYITRSRGI